MNKKGFEYRGIHTRVYNLVKSVDLDVERHIRYLMERYDINSKVARFIFEGGKEQELPYRNPVDIVKDIEKSDREKDMALASIFGMLGAMKSKAKRGIL